MTRHSRSLVATAPLVAFAHVDLGQVGLLKVGNPKGTMSH
jgi:hypothetical protein